MRSNGDTSAHAMTLYRRGSSRKIRPLSISRILKRARTLLFKFSPLANGLRHSLVLAPSQLLSVWIKMVASVARTHVFLSSEGWMRAGRAVCCIAQTLWVLLTKFCYWAMGCNSCAQERLGGICHTVLTQCCAQSRRWRRYSLVHTRAHCRHGTQLVCHLHRDWSCYTTCLPPQVRACTCVPACGSDDSCFLSRCVEYVSKHEDSFLPFCAVLTTSVFLVGEDLAQSRHSLAHSIEDVDSRVEQDVESVCFSGA